MPVMHETAKYAFHKMRVGAAIVRKSDNASCYFQPGDTADEAIDLVEGTLSELHACYFDRWCDDYADLLDETARNQRAKAEA